MRRLALAVLLLATLTFAQTRGYRVNGIVVDAVTGSPVDSAAVSIEPADHSGRPSEVTTGDDGRFVFDDVAAGKYSLSAERRGYPRQAFLQHELFSTAIVAGPELDTGNIVFRLRPECVISGHITDEHSEPVAQAQVVLLRADAGEGEMAVSQVSQRQTDDLGGYHFPHLAPGNYYLAVSARPWYAMSAGMIRNPRSASLTPEQERERNALNVAYPLTYYPSTDEFTDAEAIVLQAGDRSTADVSLHAVPALTVRIPRLLGDTRRNRSQPSLSAILPDGNTLGLSGATYRSRNGEMEIMGVAPGHYSLTTWMPGRRRNLNVATQQDVDLSADTELMPPSADALRAFSGKVDFGGVACAQCRVVLTNTASHRHYTAEISLGGDFAFSDTPLPGTYDIAVYGARDVYVRSLAASGATVRGRQLTIPGADAVSLALALANGVGRVDGFARKSGKGLAGAMILLLPENWQQNPSLVRRDQSDSDGSFSLASVVPGNYLLLVLENAWELEWRNPAVLQPFLQNAEPFQVTAGRSYKVAAEAQAVAAK